MTAFIPRNIVHVNHRCSLKTSWRDVPCVLSDGPHISPGENGNLSKNLTPLYNIITFPNKIHHLYEINSCKNVNKQLTVLKQFIEVTITLSLILLHFFFPTIVSVFHMVAAFFLTLNYTPHYRTFINPLITKNPLLLCSTGVVIYQDLLTGPDAPAPYIYHFLIKQTSKPLDSHVKV